MKRRNEERNDIVRTRSPAWKELFPFASQEGAKHTLATTIDSSDFARTLKQLRAKKIT